MEVISIMCQQAKEDTYVAWVDPKISATIYIFTREGISKMDFLEVDSSSILGTLIVEEDNKFCSECSGCTILF